MQASTDNVTHSFGEASKPSVPPIALFFIIIMIFVIIAMYFTFGKKEHESYD